MAEQNPIPPNPRFKNLTGLRFGRLTVETFAGRLSKHSSWHCRCDCGMKTVVTCGDLTTGHTSSCGCLRRDVTRARVWKHGNTGTAVYGVWLGILQRCEDRNCRSFPRYGGRGITVCERWHDFKNFLSDVGQRPRNKSIERIDNSKGYEPGNCRWATMKEQCRNRRSNHVLTWNGRTMCIAAWAEEIGIKPLTVLHRIRSGWSVERALTVRP